MRNDDNDTKQKPATARATELTLDELEADLWGSWWLAHRHIGEEVRNRQRELPSMFKPREK